MTTRTFGQNGVVIMWPYTKWLYLPVLIFT